MSFKTFERYINKCKANKVIPTLKGAEIYKKFGVVR